MSSLAFIPPQLPSLAPKPPTGERWIHEVKHDGFRTQLVVADDRARASTRNGHDWSERYPRLVAAAVDLGCRSVVLDGEAVVRDELGRSNFQALAGALRFEPHRIVLFAFDVLHLDGRDLRPQPLHGRRTILRDLLAGRGAAFPIAMSDEFDGDGAELFAAADRMGLEGIVSKRRDSRYRVALRCCSVMLCFTMCG
jgi:bifunctional non-homologous end joining protein LigD